MSNQTETGCCPRFLPEPWNDKEITWQDKLFIKDHVTSFLHIPLNFGGVVVRNMKKIESSGAENSGNMMLSYEKSLWGSDLYMAVNKEISGAELKKISGTFVAKVFEGPYKNAGKWAREMNAHVKSKGKDPKEMFFWYTTCPKCAKTYGKNYVVIFAKV